MLAPAGRAQVNYLNYRLYLKIMYEKLLAKCQILLIDKHILGLYIFHTMRSLSSSIDAISLPNSFKL